MTTAPLDHTPFRGGSVLVGASMAAVVPTLVLVVAGAFAGGSPAAYGALVGGLLVLTVSASGLFMVNLVAGAMPSAALLVAMLTYTLQVVLMALVFATLARSGLLEDALDRRWLGAAVIAAVLAWMAAHVVLATRARIPAYDVTAPEAGSTAVRGGEAGAR